METDQTPGPRLVPVPGQMTLEEALLRLSFDPPVTRCPECANRALDHLHTEHPDLLEPPV